MEQNSVITLKNDLFLATQLRMDCKRPNGTVGPNPIYMALAAERQTVDVLRQSSRQHETRKLCGALAGSFIPKGLLGSGKPLSKPAFLEARGQGFMSHIARTNLSEAVGEKILQIIDPFGQNRTTLHQWKDPHPVGVLDWHGWRASMWASDTANSKFGYLTVAATAIANKIKEDLQSMSSPNDLGLQVESAEDFSSREFGWIARIGFKDPPAALLKSPTSHEEATTSHEGIATSQEDKRKPQREPHDLPTYNTLLVEGGCPLRVVCSGGPSMTHAGGMGSYTLWKVVAYEDELESLVTSLRELGCKVSINPSDD